MRKTVLLVIILLLVLFTIIWGSAMATEEEMCVPMGGITLKALTPDPKRSVVKFPHSLHFSNDCQTCHHKWSHQKVIVGCTASGCHDMAQLPKKEGKLVRDTEAKIRYYKNAYHKMCIGCHKQIKKQNKELEASATTSEVKLAATGPTGCVECHPK